MSESNVEVKKNPVPKNFQKNNLITASSYSPQKTEKDVISEIDGGVIGTAKKKIERTNLEISQENVPVQKVALFSSKNLYWPGIGRISKGYNIVKKEFSEQWLTLSHIREASPEEIAREFGL